ncbi:MAG: SemiSWEET family transporter [Bacteroidota bacterium]
MDGIELVGHFGALLSSITFIPQVYKTWQSKSVGDLSLVMMLIVFTSTVVWLVYGVSLNLWPVIVANAIICFLSALLIYFKFNFKKASERSIG